MMADNDGVQRLLRGVVTQAVAEFSRQLEQEGFSGLDATGHDVAVEFLFALGYHQVTGLNPFCGYCGGDDHPEYGCPNRK